MPRKIEIKHFKDFAKPWIVDYAAVKTKFGDTQIGALNNAICFLYFAPANQIKSNIQPLMKKWPEDVDFKENLTTIEKLANKIFSDEDDNEIEVLLEGTDFQNKVWEILLQIPKGERWTYAECAVKMGNPSAVRALANAVANNEIAYFIPCHRVVSKDGNKFKYRWGAERKKQLLDYEAGN